MAEGSRSFRRTKTDKHGDVESRFWCGGRELLRADALDSKGLYRPPKLRSVDYVSGFRLKAARLGVCVHGPYLDGAEKTRMKYVFNKGQNRILKLLETV